jgi:hypothetical protein
MAEWHAHLPDSMVHLAQLDEPSENPPIHRSLLKRGDLVSAGQVLGLAGNTGGYNNVTGNAQPIPDTPMLPVWELCVTWQRSVT